MRGDPRLHFEQDFSNYSRVASRLLSETGATLNASVARGLHQTYSRLDKRISEAVSDRCTVLGLGPALRYRVFVALLNSYRKKRIQYTRQHP